MEDQISLVLASEVSPQGSPIIWTGIWRGSVSEHNPSTGRFTPYCITRVVLHAIHTMFIGMPHDVPSDNSTANKQ